MVPETTIANTKNIQSNKHGQALKRLIKAYYYTQLNIGKRGGPFSGHIIRKVAVTNTVDDQLLKIRYGVTEVDSED